MLRRFSKGLFSASMKLRNEMHTSVVLREEEDPPEEMDWIQKLFIEKLREYAEKQKESGEQIVDPSPEIEKEREQLMEYLKARYKLDEKDAQTFPEFNFEDPPLDSIDLEKPKAEEKK